MTIGPAPMIRMDEMSVRLGIDETPPLPFAGEGGPEGVGRGGAVARHHFLTSRSRGLRHNSTDAERRLWRVLRNRQLNGFKFRRQVEIDGYVVDFLCAEQRLIIDAHRTAFLESQGFRILRFWNHDRSRRRAAYGRT